MLRIEGLATLVAVALLSAMLDVAEAATIEKTFHVGNLTVRKLCENRVITAVNGQLPGPTIEVNKGDTLVVHVINDSPYNITIHWHGVFQRLSPWADGPNMITQCPIRPGKSYAYRFTVAGQEGTLWWHAHVSFLRATVYGALIIRPKDGGAFPFPPPHKEIPLLLGEWWNANVVDVENQGFLTGGGSNISDAFTINGRPGDLYPCSKKHTYKVNVVAGETYLLRIINAALSHQLFFKVASHTFTVVAIDASYTKPYETDVIVVAPGQTVDALMVADAPPARYYMAARPYISTGPQGPPFDNTTATGIVNYTSSADQSSPPAMPIMPIMPPFNDTPTAHRFYTNLTGLCEPGTPTVPLEVDERMFVTFGLGVVPCAPSQTLCNKTTGAVAGSMNNISFQFPTRTSLLEAHFKGVRGIYTSDFPGNPPAKFNFTDPAVNSVPALMSLRSTEKGTRLKKLKYNTSVEIVLQNTAILGAENHPLHLHGYNFFVLAQGFGKYDAGADVASYNLVDPQVRNTIAVPVGGWAAIRFTANNPGVWIFHCHLDVHLPVGLATAFEVENGPTPYSIIPPPPSDYPSC